MAIVKNAASLVVLAAVAVHLVGPGGDAWALVEVAGFFVALPVLVVLAVVDIVRSRRETRGEMQSK